MKSPVNCFRIISTLLIILLFTAGESYSQTNSTYDKLYKAVDSVRIQYEKISERKCPTLSILIHTPAETYFVSAAGEGAASLTKDTYFRFASNTKNFTSAIILNMYQSGWLDLKAKIIDNIPGSNIPYVPDIPEFDIPFKNEITIEQLLQHAAGVYDVDNDPVPGCDGMSYVDYTTFKDPKHQFELAELVNQDAINKLYYFEPSKGYHYSNTGYTILSEIIERIYSYKAGTEKKYADYIKDYITGSTAPVPLDISFPYLAADVDLPAPYAIGTIYTKDSTATYTTVNMSAHVGEGNGYTTFSELDKYIRSLMKGQNVLTPASIELMTHSVSDSNKNYALGCFHIDDLGYGHNGCIKGYLSDMLYDPITDVSVIIMLPNNDYLLPDEKGLIYGIKTLLNTGFKAREVLGFSTRYLEY